jgi:hypothetical protein
MLAVGDEWTCGGGVVRVVRGALGVERAMVVKVLEALSAKGTERVDTNKGGFEACQCNLDRVEAKLNLPHPIRNQGGPVKKNTIESIEVAMASASLLIPSILVRQ